MVVPAAFSSAPSVRLVIYLAWVAVFDHLVPAWRRGRGRGPVVVIAEVGGGAATLDHADRRDDARPGSGPVEGGTAPALVLEEAQQQQAGDCVHDADEQFHPDLAIHG
jgi:hypothetical protein